MADDTDSVLVGVSLPDAYRAQELLTAVTRLRANGELQLRDAVVVSKTDDGHTVVRETIDPQPGRSALSGAMWTSLIGLLVGGPVGWLVGGVVGAGAGATAAKVIDLGVPDEWVAWFREAVQPGTTTLVLLLGELHVGALADELHRFPGAHLVHTTLPAYAMHQLEEATGQAATAPDDLPTTPA